MLARNPELGRLGLFCSCATGDHEAIRGALAAHPEVLNTPTGPFGMPPLIPVTFSSLIRREQFGFDLRRSAEGLLDLGADVSQTWTYDRFPDSPLRALYGAAGLNHDLEMTEILLARGANPKDNESLYHSVEGPNLDCTRLLLDSGCLRNSTNALNRVLDFDNLEGLRLLLAFGAIPDGLPHAIRRRRSPAHIEELLRAGADPSNGMYRLAMINGSRRSQRCSHPSPSRKQMPSSLPARAVNTRPPLCPK